MHRITSPNADDSLIQQEIVAKGLTAPRITNEQVEAAIRSEHYFTAAHGRHGALALGEYAGREKPELNDADLSPLNLLTFCVLVLDNGFTVVGHSSCASPENFDADIGRKVARQNALNHVWPLLGFRLRDQLASQGGNAPAKAPREVEKAPESTWLTRLKVEETELLERLRKLTNFLLSTEASGLPAAQRELLYEQQVHMIMYCLVLRERLTLATE